MVKLFYILFLTYSIFIVPEKKLETGIYYVKDTATTSTIQLEYKEFDHSISILSIDTVAICKQKDFKTVNVDISGYSKNHVIITLELTQDGANKFSEASEKSIGKKLAIISDGKIISAPFVNEKIIGGKLAISGNFTISEAEKIKNELTNKSEMK